MSDGGATEEGQRDGAGTPEGAEAVRRTGPIFGAAAAALGVLLALAGAFLSTGVVGDASFTDTVPATTLGILLGLAAYVLGARRAGRVAIAVTVLAFLFGIGASQGYVPGLEPTDDGPPSTQ